MTRDEKDKDAARQERLKLALRENLRRRKAQVRGRTGAAASAAGDEAGRRDAGDEASD